jgi:predicted enzyme related to lactoylglutathione lyase
MPRVVHFEVHADDPERAVKFYAQALGWKIQRWGPMEYWLADTGPKSEPGINGAITRRNEKLATVNTASVPSLDEAMRAVKAAGGKVLTPKMTIPGVGYNAYCLDTEGNTFGIMQEDPSAK